MKNSKVLLLLFSFVILVNYINYFSPDRDKMYKKTLLLDKKIAQQKKLIDAKLDIKELKKSPDKYFFDGNRLSFSQSMGSLQKIIHLSAKDNCRIEHLKWLQTPQSNKWYDTLKMNTSLQCKPKEIFLFINKLRNNNKLFIIKNFSAIKMNKKKKIYVKFQVIAFRKKNEK